MSDEETTWFRRFGDVPGVQYETPPGIEREQIPGHDVVPEVHEYSDSLWWPWRDPETGEEGSTGQPPAGQRSEERGDDPQSPDEILRELAESLELPGYPSTYHFLIAEGQERLWKRRLRDATVIQEIIRLCHLDVELLAAHKEIIEPREGDDFWLHVRAFETLFRLHVNEGELAEAEAIAVRAIEEFGQDRFDRRLGEVRERRVAAEAEDA